MTAAAKAILRQVTDYRTANPHRDLAFDAIDFDGTIDQLHDTLIDLSDQGHIRLMPWTGAWSDIPSEQHVCTMDRGQRIKSDMPWLLTGSVEHKYFAKVG